MKFKKTLSPDLREVSLLEAAGDYNSAAELLKELYPRLQNRPAAQTWLVLLLQKAGRTAEIDSMIQGLPDRRVKWADTLWPLALMVPLLLLFTGYTAFFMVSWSGFIEELGGIEGLRSIYEADKKRSARPGQTFERDKDQIAAEKILSESFRKRFDKAIPAKEHFIMEDSYFDRYPTVYFSDNSARNFIRLTKNLSIFGLSEWEKLVPEYTSRLNGFTDPLLKFRYLLEIGYNYALHSENRKSLHYLEQALKQPVEGEFLKDAWFLKATIHYEAKEYAQAAAALENCRETVFFEAEMLSFLTSLQSVNRQSLSEYLRLDEQLVKIIERLNGDIFYLQTLYDEMEKIRRESTDPMTVFFGAEILYGMGNLKKAKLYFQEYKISERRVNFTSFKKAAQEMDRRIIDKTE